MNAINGVPIDNVPAAGTGGTGTASAGGGVDLSNYPDLADATQTVVDTIPVFQATGSKRLKLTSYKANDIDTRITTNTSNVATKANQTALDSLTTTVGTKANQTALDSLTTTVGTKANQTALDSLTITVGTKANQTALDSLTTTVGTKANQTSLDSLTTVVNDHSGSGTLHANVGKTGQGTQAVALGDGAGSNTQGDRCVAIGYNAGANNQGVQGVTIGNSAGKDSQGQDAIAIGYSAASFEQGAYAVAIGSTAANTSQGQSAIAIGRTAVAASQAANSIAVNATNSAITANQAGFFVAPIRDLNVDLSGKVLCYDNTTKEVQLRNWSGPTYLTYSGPKATNIVLVDDSNIQIIMDGTQTYPQIKFQNKISGITKAVWQATTKSINADGYALNPTTSGYYQYGFSWSAEGVGFYETMLIGEGSGSAIVYAYKIRAYSCKELSLTSNVIWRFEIDRMF